jgi:hypothetical protein
MSWFTRALLVFLGVMFAVMAFQKDLRVRGAFGSGPGTPPTRFGRICFFLIGALSILVGLTGITEFIRFSK